ncbi:MAG: hypothetical protein JST08_09470 [Actinobacteria bacterium]|nr:hypothetical protein [Actinomycetota bacterium]
MNYNEAAVFKWVIIVAIAGATVVGLTLLTRPLVGALWGLVLVIAGCVYGFRWSRDWWRNSRNRPGGPDYKP